MDLQTLNDKKERTAEWVAGEITHICRDFETRSGGTRGEEQACEYIAGVLKNQAGCERADVESFQEHPGAFYGWIYLTVSFVLAAIVLYFFAPLLSVILIAAGLLICLLEFGFYFRAVDRLFPEKTGHNVTAVKHCEGPVKRRIFFSGHCDAAWEWTVNYKLGFIGFDGDMIIGFIGVFYYLVMAIIAMVKFGAFGLLDSSSWLMKAGLWGLLFVPFIAGIYWLWNENRIVPGATDNLTGCEISTSILKTLADEGITLENTEVGVIIAGSEEAGLRGSKAWAEAHQGEFDDVPTYIVSLDSIGAEKYLGVNFYDLNGMVHLDKGLSSLFRSAADGVGVHCAKTGIPLLGGSTDGAAFAQGGFRATSVCAMSHSVPRWYHTRLDTPENLSKSGIAACYSACIRLLQMFDEGALDS